VKRIAIVQSNYIPWKGYFDMIAQVDEFVLLDDVQYTKRDWRNRNRIKTAQGTQWLTIPVLAKGRYFQRIDETLVRDSQWAVDHWKGLIHAYAGAAHFDRYRERFALLYEECASEKHLSRINRLLIETICEALGIETTLRYSTEYEAAGIKTDRLLNICLEAGANEYLSGPRAREYLDHRAFEEAGVRVEWMDYSDYREYPQVHPPFDHYVTVLDLIFNIGLEAPDYMKAARRAA
jgi:hypothetical protein